MKRHKPRTKDLRPRTPDPGQRTLEYPQPLTERYRPQRIADFLGLEKPKRVLSRFAEAPRSDSFIFVGASGNGKTTIALALAKQLGAEVHHIPSQKCTVEAIEEVWTRCHYVSMFGANGLHLVLVDEADKMTNAAQLALLSKTDSTGPAPNTVWIFTCNDTGSLERRFVSRQKVLDFDTRHLDGDLTAFLHRVWTREAPEDAPVPDLDLIAHDALGNVRDALNKLEVELLAA